MSEKRKLVDQMKGNLNNYTPFDVYPRGSKKTELLQQASLVPEAKNLRQINLLILGQPGVGKSSYISTIYRTLQNDYQGTALATVGKNQFHSVTQKKRCYFVNIKQNIAIHDTKGLENLLQQELDVVEVELTKRLKDNVAVKQKAEVGIWDRIWYLCDSAALLDPDIFLKGNPTVNDIPHAVIVVFDATTDDIPPPMVQFIKKLEKNKYVPIYLITKCDVGEAPGDACGMLQNFERKKEQLEAFLKANYLGVGNTALAKDIILCPNYTQWGVKIDPVVGIDFQAVQILEKAVTRAEDWLEQRHYAPKGDCVIS